MQITLRYHGVYDKNRFINSVQVSYPPDRHHKVCAYRDEQLCNQARLHNIPLMSMDDLRRMKKDEKRIEKLAL